MKINSIILAAAAMVFAVACNKELPAEAPEGAGETVVFTASVDGADSKAVLKENKTEWVAGDKVTIHNGTKGFEFAAESAGATTDLKYVGNDFSGEKFMAVYPAGEYTADVAAKTVKANIPLWQQAQKGTFDANAALAVAYTETNTLNFKNATTLLKFTVNTDNVTHVVFCGNKGEGITGDVNVKLTDAGAQVEVLPTEIIKDGEKIADLGSWVEMYAYHDEDNRYFEKGETYYIAIAPQTFAEGVSVKIRINEGDELLVKTTTKAATFNANTVYNLGEFVYEASAVTPTVSKVYLRPGVWSADGAWFSAHLWGAENQDITLTEEENGLYSVSVSEGQTGMKFCRMNPAYDVFSWNTETETDHVWTETGDLEIPEAGSDKVCYVVTGWDSAEWMTVEEALAYQETVTPDPTTPRVTKVYLRPGVWSADGAWFSAHLWGAENQDITLTEEENGLYSVSVSEGQTGMKFCRMNPAYDAFSWNTETETDHVWTETGDLSIPTADDDKVCYVITDWNTGEWKTVADALAGMGTETPETTTPGQDSEWAIIGEFSNWKDKTLVTTEDANVLVAKSVDMKAAEGFLVRKPSTDWADKYGVGSVNYIKKNQYVTTAHNGGDLCVEADGTYDIYFNTSTKALYLMAAGTAYDSATQQTVNGEEPKQEEPEVTDVTIYLKPNSNWKSDNARFAAYFFGNGDIWVSMTDSDGDGVYEVNLPTGYDYGCNVIFCRMNPGTTGNIWNNKWNQTSDLIVPTDGKNLYTVAEGAWDKGDGVWSVK